MSRLRVMTMLGTRPEIIRLSRVIPRLDALCDHLVLHTGQNSDPRLADVFFDDLGLRRPDIQLDCARPTLAETLAEVFRHCGAALARHRPDAVLVLGDTNSALGAVLARRMGIPVFHMEAGNRAFDRRIPEEINRRVIDHVADVNLVYTEAARRNLLAEGVPPDRIHLTGSPMQEVLADARPRIAASEVLDELRVAPGEFVVASLHRQENVDIPERLHALMQGLDAIAAAWKMPVILSTHPRTRARLDAMGAAVPDRIRCARPFPYFDYLALQMGAACTVSDSGTIGEEAAILGFPAISPRPASERPEAMEAGAFVLCDAGAGPMLEAASTARALSAQTGRTMRIPTDYTVPDTSARVAALVVGLARRLGGAR